ncbi:unnamed protein product [Cunninghamella blakesleeana]
MLVDIANTWEYMDVKCVKRNMYDEKLKYITLSYRWGELNEQLVKTPDYTAHVTSFDVELLIDVCYCIKYNPDFRRIPYLWIDAISVDQHDRLRKKETVLKMSDIYKKATYILAIPDLYWNYLSKNIANQEVIELIYKHRDRIHQEIGHSSTDSMYNTNNTISNSTQDTKNQNDELKRAYQFLAYLIDGWSNRAWVISEYQIAKEKFQQHGAPLKYTFISLLRGNGRMEFMGFFSFTFDNHNQYNSNALDINYDTNMKCN